MLHQEKRVKLAKDISNVLKKHNVELTDVRSEKIESFVEILLFDTLDYGVK